MEKDVTQLDKLTVSLSRLFFNSAFTISKTVKLR